MKRNLGVLKCTDRNMVSVLITINMTTGCIDSVHKMHICIGLEVESRCLIRKCMMKGKVHTLP